MPAVRRSGDPTVMRGARTPEKPCIRGRRCMRWVRTTSHDQTIIMPRPRTRTSMRWFSKNGRHAVIAAVSTRGMLPRNHSRRDGGPRQTYTRRPVRRRPDHHVRGPVGMLDVPERPKNDGRSGAERNGGRGAGGGGKQKSRKGVVVMPCQRRRVKPSKKKRRRRTGEVGGRCAADRRGGRLHRGRDGRSDSSSQSQFMSARAARTPVL